MSSVMRNEEKHSESELVEWMRAKPRTMGWDFVMAYDRNTADHALLCDYSERFDFHPLAQAITVAVVLSENRHWEHLYGIRFGAPRLSFENSVIDGSSAILDARATAGSQLTVEQVNAQAKHINKIEVFTPLHGPRLVMAVELDDPTGDATAAGQVRIDLGAGRDYRFGFATTEEAQRIGGAILRDRFRSLPIESRCCVVNALDHTNGGPLAPNVVRVRTESMPGTDGATSSSGDGAVVLFAAARGSSEGSLPDELTDWMHPIPAGYSAAMLIGNRSLMTRAIPQDIRIVSPDASFKFDCPDDPNGVVSSLTATGGTLATRLVETVVPPFSKVSYEYRPVLAGEKPDSGAFSITRQVDALRFRWKSSSFGEETAWYLRTLAADGSTALDYAWRVQQEYRFAGGLDGQVELVPQGEVESWATSVYRQGGDLDALHYHHFPELSDSVSEVVAQQIAASLSEMAAFGGVEQLRAAGVAFPGSLVTLVESAHLPTDLALFGKTGAVPGAFVLEPSQPVLEAGATLQLSVKPNVDGLGWNVEPADGFDGDPGSVSVSGFYVAPAAEKLTGWYTVVRVTASSANFTATSLIYVMRRRIAVNPLVFASSSTAGKTRLAARAVDGGALDWSLISATGATLVPERPSEGSPADPDDQLYVPGSLASGELFSVDEVTATDPRAGDTQTVFVLVAETELLGSIKIRDDSGLPANQIQLAFDGGEGPLAGTTWEVVIGGGSIDENGLYTIDPESPHPFAVVTAVFTIPNVMKLCNYLILPIPLVDLDDVRRALA